MKIVYVLIITAIFSVTVFAQDDNSDQSFIRISVFDENQSLPVLKTLDVTLEVEKKKKIISQLLFEESEPVAVSIIIDDTFYPVAAAQTALQFIQKANSENDYCIIGFNEKIELLADWKSNDEAIVSSLNKIASSKAKSKESVSLDAVAYGLEKLEQSSLKKKVLLIFGTSYDTKSKTGFEDLRETAANSDSIIYGVRFYTSEVILQRDRKFEKITEMSGGRSFDFYIDSGSKSSYSHPEFPGKLPIPKAKPKTISTPKDLEASISKFCDRLVANVEKTYLISYQQNPDNNDENIEVKVNMKDADGKKIKFKARIKKLSLKLK